MLLLGVVNCAVLARFETWTVKTPESDSVR